jgi:hypothetical protein
METIKQVLMRRDKLSPLEADDALAEARKRIKNGDDPQDVVEEEFGLEPDYIWDVL